MSRSLRPVVDDHLVGLGTRPLSVFVHAVLVAVICGGVVWISMARADGLERAFRSQVAEGRYVVVIAAGIGALDAADCERLTGFSFVEAAGSVLSDGREWSTLDPQFGFDRTVVTAGWVRVMFPSTVVATGRGLLAGATVARRLGLAPGAYLALAADPGADSGPARIGAVLPSSRRSEPIDRSVVDVRSPVGTARACYASLRPGADSQLLEAGFPPTNAVAVSRLHPEMATERRPELELSNASTPETWIGMVALIMVGVGERAFRRRDTALYRLLGANAATLSALAFTDLFVVAFPAMLSGVAVAMVGASDALAAVSVREALLVAVGFLTAAILVEPVLGVVGALRMSVPSTLKR